MKQKNILFLDDMASLSSIPERLEKLGYKVFAVSRTADAVAILETEHIDLILSDWGLSISDISGEHFVWLVKGKCPKTPLVVFSGFPRSEIEPYVPLKTPVMGKLDDLKKLKDFISNKK